MRKYVGARARGPHSAAPRCGRFQVPSLPMSRTCLHLPPKGASQLRRQRAVPPPPPRLVGEGGRGDVVGQRLWVRFVEPNEAGTKRLRQRGNRGRCCRGAPRFGERERGGAGGGGTQGNTHEVRRPPVCVACLGYRVLFSAHNARAHLALVRDALQLALLLLHAVEVGQLSLGGRGAATGAGAGAGGGRGRSCVCGARTCAAAIHRRNRWLAVSLAGRGGDRAAVPLRYCGASLGGCRCGFPWCARKSASRDTRSSSIQNHMTSSRRRTH